jgi:hypothetical protein
MDPPRFSKIALAAAAVLAALPLSGNPPWPVPATIPRAIGPDSEDSSPLRGRIAPVQASEPVRVPSRPDVLREEERKIVGFLLEKYGETDWSVPLREVVANPDAVGNPNVVMIPLSLAQAHLFRWRAAGVPADLESAVAWGEWVGAHHDAWGVRWLSPLVVCYFELTSRSLAADAAGTELESRAAAVRAEALAIDAVEADACLSDAYPFLPLDSSQGGDTKAEEDAWVAALLAGAANSLPEADHAALWDMKARQLAYDSITIASDPPDRAGVKTTTVRDDFALPNHGFIPNEYYTAATLHLRGGAIFYRLAGHPVPAEFSHHVADLFAAYLAHVDAALGWTAPCDEGDATLFPLVIEGGEAFERQVVAAKRRAGFLWRPGGPIAHVGTGEVLFEAIQDAKTVEQYLIGSYFWHWRN